MLSSFRASYYRLTRANTKGIAPHLKKRSPSRLSVNFARSPLADASRLTTKMGRDKGLDISHRRIPDYRYSNSKDDTLVDVEQDEQSLNHDSNSDSDESVFHWQEEATLLSDLMEEPPEETEDQQINFLAESLHTAFTDQGRRLKKEIAKTLVPTHNHVKAVYNVLEEKVDVTYAKGSILFNTACRDMEGTIYAQQADLNEALTATKTKLELLFEELRQDCATRDELWSKLKASLHEIVAPVLESTKDTPAKVERTIAKLEKYSKSLENDNSDPNALKKSLQDLLKT